MLIGIAATIETMPSASWRPPRAGRGPAGLAPARQLVLDALRDGALDPVGERVDQRGVVRRSELAPHLEQRLGVLAPDLLVRRSGMAQRY